MATASVPPAPFGGVAGGSDGARQRRERLIRLALAMAATISVVAVVAILVFLLSFALPLATGGQLGNLFSWRWRPLAGEFGILTMVVGTLCLASSAMLVAFPLGVALCCFMHGIGPARAAPPLRSVIRLLSSVPTVVYGLIAVFLLVPAIRDAFGGSGFSWLAALLALSLLVLPTIVLIVDQQFAQVAAPLRLTATALGLSPAQQLLRLILPLSRRGLVVAAALGFARAVGDTLLPLMLAGNAVKLPQSLLDPLRTLTSHIALVVATDSQSVAYHSLFACGVILFVFSIAVNLALHRLRAHPEAGHGA